MLGPSGYQTTTLRDVEIPSDLRGDFGAPSSDELSALIIGFGLRAVTQVEMWRRLFDTEFSADKRWRAGYAADSWTQADLEAARDILPPSRRWQLALWQDEANIWRQWLQPSDAKMAFVIFPRAKVVMAGPGNEDAWDEAQALMRLEASPPSADE